MSVLVVGSMAYDAVETPFAEIARALGGSAMFFSAAASYFSPVNLVAVVGNDFDHNDIDFLRERQVDLLGLTTVKGETFRWSGKYADNMIDRQTIYTKLGVFENFDPVLPERYTSSEYVFLANIQPDLQYNVVQQVKNPRFIAMDTMNFWITGTLDELKKTLSVVDALIINDSEVRLLSREANLFIGAKTIQAMGPKTLIVKKGEHGSILVHEDSYFMCPALPVEQVHDPTGAGDTFAGGFMGYLAMAEAVNEAVLRRAVVMGTVMASFCVESFSAQRLKTLTPDEIKARTAQLLTAMRLESDGIWIQP